MHLIDLQSPARSWQNSCRMCSNCPREGSLSFCLVSLLFFQSKLSELWLALLILFLHTSRLDSCEFTKMWASRFRLLFESSRKTAGSPVWCRNLRLDSYFWLVCKISNSSFLYWRGLQRLNGWNLRWLPGRCHTFGSFASSRPRHRPPWPFRCRNNWINWVSAPYISSLRSHLLQNYCRRLSWRVQVFR